MAVTIPTPNKGAVPSADIENVVFAGAKIDEFATSTNHYYIDRLGVQRFTAAGLIYYYGNKFYQAVSSIGYNVVGRYEDGVQTLSSYSDLIEYNGEFYKLKPSITPPFTTTGTTSETWSVDSYSLVSVGDGALRSELAANDGLSKIGQCDSFDNLRSITPEFSGQSIFLQSYNSGWASQLTPTGGDIFDAVNQNLTDDGGFVAKVSDSWSWVRRRSESEANIFHFGATEGATYDIADSLLLMHKALGFVRIPPGKFGISSITDSTITSFNLHGTLNSYGRSVVSNLYLIGTGTSTVFQLTKAQVTSISNLNIVCNSYGGMFYDNTALSGGKFYSLNKLIIRNAGSVVFNMTDTLDTLITEIYSYACAGSILKVSWDNQLDGYWDHSTAIALRDCNFNGSTTMQTLDMPRVTQGRMDNVWFQDCEYPMDISQGQWDINTLCVEGPSNPIYAKYAKISSRDEDFQGSNAYFDFTLSGYDSSWDNSSWNNGNIPSWVTSGYENGYTRSNARTLRINGEISAKAVTPLYRLPDTSTDTWFYIGTIVMTGVGIAVEMRLSGSAGFNAVDPSTTNPRTASIGNGTSVIRIQHKGTTDGLTVSWHNEGSGAVQGVMYTQPYNTDVNVYVKIPAYTYKTGIFITTTDFNRLDQGATFQFTPYLSIVSDINAISGIKKAPAIHTINSGQNGAGYGMDLDKGILLYQGSLDSTATKLPIYINGTIKYLTLSDS